MENTTKKFSPLHVALITAIITAIICALIAICIISSDHSVAIGDIVTEEVSISSETGESNTRTATFVYLGASSKLYTDEGSDASIGLFIDLFEKEEMVKLIDSNEFPYKQEFVATTSSSEITRYMIRAENGSIFWIEP